MANKSYTALGTHSRVVRKFRDVLLRFVLCLRVVHGSLPCREGGQRFRDGRVERPDREAEFILLIIGSQGLTPRRNPLARGGKKTGFSSRCRTADTSPRVCLSPVHAPQRHLARQSRNHEENILATEATRNHTEEMQSNDRADPGLFRCNSVSLPWPKKLCVAC